MKCCKKPHVSDETESCGCIITLCFMCGDERLVQPCHDCEADLKEAENKEEYYGHERSGIS